MRETEDPVDGKGRRGRRQADRYDDLKLPDDAWAVQSFMVFSGLSIASTQMAMGLGLVTYAITNVRMWSSLFPVDEMAPAWEVFTCGRGVLQQRSSIVASTRLHGDVQRGVKGGAAVTVHGVFFQTRANIVDQMFHHFISLQADSGLPGRDSGDQLALLCHRHGIVGAEVTLNWVCCAGGAGDAEAARIGPFDSGIISAAHARSDPPRSC